MKCEHCCGQNYVFVYWLEQALKEQGVHITDIPAEVFEKIPVHLLVPCHCNGALFLPSKINKANSCFQCAGSTWIFSEVAEQAGYRFKKVVDISPEIIETIGCDFFERCACDNEDTPKTIEARNSFKDILSLLDIPKVRFNFMRSSFPIGGGI